MFLPCLIELLEWLFKYIEIKFLGVQYKKEGVSQLLQFLNILFFVLNIIIFLFQQSICWSIVFPVKNYIVSTQGNSNKLARIVFFKISYALLELITVLNNITLELLHKIFYTRPLFKTYIDLFSLILLESNNKLLFFESFIVVL